MVFKTLHDLASTLLSVSSLRRSLCSTRRAALQSLEHTKLISVSETMLCLLGMDVLLLRVLLLHTFWISVQIPPQRSLLPFMSITLNRVYFQSIINYFLKIEV